MELCNGCSQKVQSFKRWQEALHIIIGAKERRQLARTSRRRRPQQRSQILG
jgi:hypothetical protein